MKNKTTNILTDILTQTNPDQLNDYFDTQSNKLITEERPFTTYMREMFHKKRIKQQDVFSAADISLGYGYKLISEEKKSKQKDVILRLCIAARFDLNETQHALQLYGMAPLYPKFQRDSVLIVALNHGIHEIDKVNEMLITYGFEPLYSCNVIE